MLPLSDVHHPPRGWDGSGPARRSRLAPSVRLVNFFKRLVHLPQMDFEFALWQMLYLLIAPKRVYRTIFYHKQTKNQWARDDPAFIVVMSVLLTVCAIMYGVAFGLGIVGVIKLVLTMVCVDFVLVGCIVATLAWWLCNRFLRAQSVHSVEQMLEWGYAFDVHCNAFVPILLLLYLVQFFFMPILVNDTIWSRLLGNTLYFAALVYYEYITFLGYNAMPFLQRTVVFLYPIGLLAITYIVSLFTFNASSLVLNAYFRI